MHQYCLTKNLIPRYTTTIRRVSKCEPCLTGALLLRLQGEAKSSTNPNKLHFFLTINPGRDFYLNKVVITTRSPWSLIIVVNNIATLNHIRTAQQQHRHYCSNCTDIIVRHRTFQLHRPNQNPTSPFLFLKIRENIFYFFLFIFLSTLSLSLLFLGGKRRQTEAAMRKVGTTEEKQKTKKNKKKNRGKT
nr:hypothetical protein Iba_chr12bCG4470 [Ipomoea batatas]